MGPRSIDRGNVCGVQLSDWVINCASMGPRSIDRGNNVRAAVAALTATALQWGRDQLIAEMGRGQGFQRISVGLQWGRDQLIAEIRHRDTPGGVPALASMGPRSIDRGNLRLRPGIEQGNGLQWGRDQLIAEIPSCRYPPQGPEPLQWGRDQLIAEMAGFAPVPIPHREASMGPRSIDRGNAGPRPGLGLRARLQWGRDQLIAEIAGRNRTRTDRSRASMGPRSIDRGNARAIIVTGAPGVGLQWGRDQLIAEIETGLTA